MGGRAGGEGERSGDQKKSERRKGAGAGPFRRVYPHDTIVELWDGIGEVWDGSGRDWGELGRDGTRAGLRRNIEVLYKQF